MENLILLFNLIKTPTIRDKIILKILYYLYLYIKDKKKKEKPMIVIVEREGEWDEVMTNPNLFCGK
jgi:hypothetical protein